MMLTPYHFMLPSHLHVVSMTLPPHGFMLPSCCLRVLTTLRPHVFNDMLMPPWPTTLWSSSWSSYLWVLSKELLKFGQCWHVDNPSGASLFPLMIHTHQLSCPQRTYQQRSSTRGVRKLYLVNIIPTGAFSTASKFASILSSSHYQRSLSIFNVFSTSPSFIQIVSFIFALFKFSSVLT